MNGKVVGIVVARISDIAVMHLSGTVPQNVNYAIKVKILREFLSAIPDVLIPPAKYSPKPEEIIKTTEEGVAMLLVY